MNETTAKCFDLLKRKEVVESISLTSQAASIPSPIAGIALQSFKSVASIVDEIKLNHILRGIASGLNQEEYISELENYISSKPENAWAVESNIKKALLADSPIACTLLGRMLAEHVKDKTPYDRSDAIVAHALETATDDDIFAFREMMKTYKERDQIGVRVSDQDAADWCLSNRIFKEVFSHPFKGDKVVSTDFDTIIEPTKAAEKLLYYINEIKQLFREKLI